MVLPPAQKSLRELADVSVVAGEALHRRKIQWEVVTELRDKRQRHIVVGGCVTVTVILTVVIDWGDTGEAPHPRRVNFRSVFCRVRRIEHLRQLSDHVRESAVVRRRAVARQSVLEVVLGAEDRAAAAGDG